MDDQSNPAPDTPQQAQAPSPPPAPPSPEPQPQYQQSPQFTQPPAPVPSKKSKRRLILIIAAVIIVVAIAVAVLILVSNGSDKDKKTAHSRETASSKSSSDSSSDSSENNPVAGVLAGQQQYARDTKRQSDMVSVQTQLEAYFQNFGYYPSFAEMNSPTWRNANMKSMDPYSLVDPKSSCDPTKQGCLVTTPRAGAYAYAVTDTAGKSCEADATKCAAYTVTAIFENARNGSKTYSKQNLD
jgi:hypothetical protein